MSDTRETSYLQHVLALDPKMEAEVILRRRREFLQPTDVVLADLADDKSNHRMRMLHRLHAVRQAFWRLDDAELVKQLSSLQTAAHAMTAAAAARLWRVAAQRDAVRSLAKEPGVHPVFMKTLTEVLIAPAAEANRLREREHRHMRPEQNEHYEWARSIVQQAAHIIRSKYPDVFALEEAWLTELLEYDPVKETEDKFGGLLFGLATAAGIVLTLSIIIAIVGLIFS